MTTSQILDEPKTVARPRSSKEIQLAVIDALENRRRVYGSPCITTLADLLEEIGEDPSGANAKNVVAACNGRTLGKRVVVTAPTKVSAKQKFCSPVCLEEDLNDLLESDELLEFAFQLRESGTTARGFKTGELTKVVRSSKNLPSLLGRSLKQQIARDSLPFWVGCIPMMNKQVCLYRIETSESVVEVKSAATPIANAYHSERNDTPSNDATSENTTSHNTTPHRDFAESQTRCTTDVTDRSTSGDAHEREFEAAFDIADRASNSRNFVKLHSLRLELPDWDRRQFDSTLNALRRQKRFTLNSADGNHVALTSDEREAGIHEAGSLLVYCSRRSSQR